MNIVLTLHSTLDDVDTGAPGSLLQLARVYEERGHRTWVITLDDMPRRLPERLRMILFPLLVAWRCRRLVRDEDVDVVDAACGDLWAYGLVRGRRRPPVTVYRSHGSPLIYYEERAHEAALGRLRMSWRDHLYWGRLKTFELRASLRRSDVAVFLSRREAEHAQRALGASRAQSVVIPLGIPTVFIGLPLAPTPPAGAPLRIAMVGHYIPRKGVHYAAQALREVLDARPEVSVSFLGTGVDADHVLRDFDYRHHARIAVVPHYPHGRLPELLADHQIKLFPTLAEGFGKALLEAMACGLAPVAADAEGVLDILTDGVDGIVVQRRDAVALRDALLRLIGDRDELDGLRRAAHARAQTFTWDRSADERLAAYARALHPMKPQAMPVLHGTPAACD